MIHPYVYIGLPRSKEPVDCMAIICDKLDLDEKMVRSRKRNRILVVARHIYFFLCSDYYHRTFKSIGRDVGRDHSTVIFGVQRLLNDYETDSDFRHKFKSICHAINHEYAATIERRLKEVREHYDNLRKDKTTNNE